MAFGLGVCLPGLAIAAHGRTATRVPARPVVDSLPLRRKPRRLKRATGTFLRAGFRIHNHLPPKQKKDIPFGMSFCFGGRWWIRTTEVIDDRFTVCSLWPLGKPSIFNYQLDWSWWTDLNPRPADYKSAALPTELHQRFSLFHKRFCFVFVSLVDCSYIIPYEVPNVNTFFKLF